MVANIRIDIPATYRVGLEDSMRFMRRVLLEMDAQAKIICLQGEYVTGHLASTIEIQGPLVVGTEVRGAIGSRADYALSVHNGAKIHEIFPKEAVGIIRYGHRGRPQLKFYWRKKGRVAFFPHIPGSPSTYGRSHPGIKFGKRFLAIPLEQVGRRNGFNVRLT